MKYVVLRPYCLGSLLTLSDALCSDMKDRGEREANNIRKKGKKWQEKKRQSQREQGNTAALKSLSQTTFHPIKGQI